MPRKPKQSNFNASGKTIQDLLAYEFKDVNKMSFKDLKAYSSRLVSASNKRIRRAEASGLSKVSPAYQAHRNDSMLKNQYSIKGLTRNQLLNVVQDMRSFLNRKTSTLKGYKEYKSNLYKTLTGKSNISYFKKHPEKEYDFWNAYNKLSEYSAIQKVKSKEIVQDAFKVFIKNAKKGMPIEEILKDMQDSLDALEASKGSDDFMKANQLFDNELSQDNFVQLSSAKRKRKK